jgi:Tfp pilus assembly protein PilE
VKALDSRGITLVEVAIAVGIVAIAVGGLFGAVLPAVRNLTLDADDAALQAYVDGEMRTARDVLKYDGSTLTPAAIATSVPIPHASPLPVNVQLSVAAINGATVVTIAAYDTGNLHHAQAQATILARAPQPGRTFAPAALVPEPTGAP